MKNLIQPLAKKVFEIPLGLTAAASVADAGIHKNKLGSGTTTIIVMSLEDYGLLLKGVSETIQNEAKDQKGGFLRTLFGTLDANLLRNKLAGKGTHKAGDRIIWAGYGSSKNKDF